MTFFFLRRARKREWKREGESARGKEGKEGRSKEGLKERGKETVGKEGRILKVLKISFFHNSVRTRARRRRNREPRNEEKKSGKTKK